MRGALKAHVAAASGEPLPNLAAHIHLARQAAQRLGDPRLESHMGHYLMGSTSPDIRVITRRKREEYHFASLDFDRLGTGVAGMFEARPELRVASDHDGPTQAFIAGYITHLTVDETWIMRMFRPYFGDRSIFDDETEGHVMDRVLQLELDRQSWESVDSTLSLLVAATGRVGVGFIPQETLDEWRKWVTNHLGGGFSWERLRFMARRIAAGDETHRAHRLADDFLREMPDSLDGLHNVVSRSDLDVFKSCAVDTLTRTVGEYLA